MKTSRLCLTPGRDKMGATEVPELGESRAGKGATMSWHWCSPPRDPAPHSGGPLCSSSGLGLGPSYWRILPKTLEGDAVPPSRSGELICPGTQSQPRLLPPGPAFLSATSKTPGQHPVIKHQSAHLGGRVGPIPGSRNRCGGPCVAPASNGADSASLEDPGAHQNTRVHREHAPPHPPVLPWLADRPRDSGQQLPGWVSTAVPPSSPVPGRSAHSPAQVRVTGAGKGPRRAGRWRGSVRPAVLLCWLRGGS